MDLALRKNVSLSAFCTLGLGGPARYYTEATHEDGVRAAESWAKERGLPLLVLGGGSNLVIADEGFPGLVLHLALAGVTQRSLDGDIELEAGAGEDWDRLVARTVEAGLAGFECLSGIPGRVGATPIQNVGAYGQEVKDTLTRLEVFDRETLDTLWLDNDACEFGYRQSRFKERDRGRYIVLRVAYRLRPGGPPAVRYAELARHTAENGSPDPTVAEVRAAVLHLRRRKSMVLDPQDPDSRSVGSFFMNPIVPEATFERLEQQVRAGGLLADGQAIPHFPGGLGHVKLSAAWLIERAGLHKGLVRGPVGLSRNHTLAIVNRGGARAADVAALAREVRHTVRERFGITLVPEPVFVNLSLD
jgi:UDP-N-acetylmuramate dehydrogenase